MPLLGVGWLARQVAEAALQEMLDPARIEAALLTLERRLEAGEIDEAEYEAGETELLEALARMRATWAGGAARMSAARSSPMSAAESAAHRAGLPLIVAGARGEDAGRGIARLYDRTDLATLGAAPGALLSITGRRTAYARALPLPPEQRGGGVVQIDGAIRGNAGAAIGDAITVVAVADATPARRVRLAGAGVAAARRGAATRACPACRWPRGIGCGYRWSAGARRT